MQECDESDPCYLLKLCTLMPEPKYVPTFLRQPQLETIEIAEALLTLTKCEEPYSEVQSEKQCDDDADCEECPEEVC